MSGNCNRKSDHDLVSGTIKKYNDHEYIPIENTSIDIKTENNIYKLIRLNDEQYYQLHKYRVALFEDYTHLMSLSVDKSIIYSSFSKMYTAIKLLFGESGKYFDDWKGSFSFPFLIHFYKDEEEFEYVMNLQNVRSSIEFSIAKLISADVNIKRNVLHEPFEEFPKEEIRYFINYFVGYLSGYLESSSKYYNEFFFKTVGSNLILFGFDDGQFFDYQYENEEEYRKAIEELKNKKQGRNSESDFTDIIKD